MLSSKTANTSAVAGKFSDGPSISVVIPTFNRSRLIGRTIDSVLEQTYAAAEIIVVDDCSSDDTSSKVAGYCGPIPLIYTRLERNGGGAAARNAGIVASSGDYLAFLDSDDEWHPDHLLTLLNVATREAGHFVVASSAIKVGRKGRVLPGRPFPRGKSIAEKLHFVITAELAFQTSTLMVPRKTILQFMFDSRLRRYQDWDLIFRFIENNVAMILLPDATTIYHPAISANISSTRSELPSLRFVAKHKDIMGRKSMARFVALQIMRRRGIGIGLIKYLVCAVFLRSLTLKEFLFYVRESWRPNRFSDAGTS